MSTFIATFIIIAIKGSCGGLNQVGLAGSCSGACSADEKEVCELKKAALAAKEN